MSSKVRDTVLVESGWKVSTSMRSHLACSTCLRRTFPHALPKAAAHGTCQHFSASFHLPSRFLSCGIFPVTQEKVETKASDCALSQLRHHLNLRSGRHWLPDTSRLWFTLPHIQGSNVQLMLRSSCPRHSSTTCTDLCVGCGESSLQQPRLSVPPALCLRTHTYRILQSETW
jgi:hypothetical protein